MVEIIGSNIKLLEMDVLKPGKVEDPYRKLAHLQHRKRIDH